MGGVARGSGEFNLVFHLPWDFAQWALRCRLVDANFGVFFLVNVGPFDFV